MEAKRAQYGRARTWLLASITLLLLLGGGVYYLISGPHGEAELAVPAAAPAAARSNLLVIMVDDLDQAMFDLLLAENWLPHIRRYLVEGGVRFDNSYVSNPVCCPSRATYLTGQYTHNHGILNVMRGVAFWYLRPHNREDRVLPVVLQQAGYFTGHIGKYLNGYGLYSPAEHVPQGYDRWYGLVDPYTYDMYDYKANITPRGGPTEVREFRQDAGSVYQTDQLADWAVEFLDAAAAQEKPFYLALKPVPPHGETLSFDNDLKMGYRSVFREYIRPAPRHACLVKRFLPDYREPEQPDPVCSRSLPDSLAFLRARPSFNRIDKDKHPRFAQVLQTLTTEGGDFGALERQHQMRMASMLGVDDLVGEVLGRLEQQNKLADTLVVFTSDNGYFHGEHGLSSKLVPYEESIRVPLVVRAPAGGARHERRGELVLNNDLAPTLADYAGAQVLQPEDAYDGASLRGLVAPGGGGWPRKQFFVEHFIETTTTELAKESALYDKLSATVIGFLEKLRGFEFGTLGNLSYPAYKAVRRDADGRRLLYVQWYEGLSNRPEVLGGEWKIEFEELYDLERDPFQMVNLMPLLANDTALAAATAGMRDDVAAFRDCAGAACRALEEK